MNRQNSGKEWESAFAIVETKGENDHDRHQDESTIRRFLQKQDANVLDARAGQWLASIGKLHGPNDIAIDGKTLRGSHDGEKRAVHLLSAILQKEGVVIAQRAVPAKTNEITEVKPRSQSRTLVDREQIALGTRRYF